MSSQKTYKYDIAFSFLQQDEGLALSMADALGEEISTFIYSEKQAELVGKDGEEQFATVFGEEARIVAILYRDGWGESPWTRIEKTAIKNRAYEQGYDFTVFISLEERGSLPAWVPKNRIWYNFQKFGPAGAAASLENRLSEMGATRRPQTAAERAARMQRTLELAARRRDFLESVEAVGTADAEAKSLMSSIKSAAEAVSGENSTIRIGIKQDTDKITIRIADFMMYVGWFRYFCNSLSKSGLHVVLSEVDKSRLSYPEPLTRPIRKYEFSFSVSDSDEHGWVENNPPGRFFNSSSLAEFLLKELIQKVEGRLLRGL